MKVLLALPLVALLSGCEISKAYGKEYVLYDPNNYEEGEAGPEADATAAPAAASATEIVDPLSKPEPEPAAAAEAAPAAAPTDAAGREALNQVFLLEAVVDELSRAIVDGLDQDGSLRSKRDALQVELLERKRALGESYGTARRARLQQLRTFSLPQSGGGGN